MLEVLRALGYRKVADPTEMPGNANKKPHLAAAGANGTAPPDALPAATDPLNVD